MYYHIKKVGETRIPHNPYFSLTMAGHTWGSRHYAYKFSSIEQAKQMLGDLTELGEKVFLEWHDDSENPPHGSWGEVNPHYLSTIGA